MRTDCSQLNGKLSQSHIYAVHDAAVLTERSECTDVAELGLSFDYFGDCVYCPS